jgi:hypothetical protein
MAVTYIWRGPFRVEPDGRRKWKIVNRHGTAERLGYIYKGVAREECRLMNLAQASCDLEEARDLDIHAAAAIALETLTGKPRTP